MSSRSSWTVAWQKLSVVNEAIFMPYLYHTNAPASVELDELRVHSWIRLRLLWGFRKRTSTAESNEEMRSSWNPNRQIHIYHSSEEMQAAKQRWLDTTGEIPVSQVEIAKGKGNTILI